MDSDASQCTTAASAQASRRRSFAPVPREQAFCTRPRSSRTRPVSARRFVRVVLGGEREGPVGDEPLRILALLGAAPVGRARAPGVEEQLAQRVVERAGAERSPVRRRRLDAGEAGEHAEDGSATREPVARTIRRSFGESGLRNGEQTSWCTRQRAVEPRSTSLTSSLCTSPPSSRIEAGGRARRCPARAVRSQSHSCSNERLNAAQCSRSTARRSRSLRFAREPAPADRRRAPRSMPGGGGCRSGRKTGSVLAMTRWSNAPVECSTIQSHSSSSIIWRRSVDEHARRARVEDEQARVAEVAVEGPAACRRLPVPLVRELGGAAGRRRPRPSRAESRLLRRARAARGCRDAGRSSRP